MVDLPVSSVNAWPPWRKASTALPAWMHCTFGGQRESLVTLTGLLGYIGQEVRESDLAYKRELQRCLLAHAKANRARIEAETSPEYARMLEAKGAEREVVEMIRSCRAYLRSLDEEMRLSR